MAAVMVAVAATGGAGTEALVAAMVEPAAAARPEADGGGTEATEVSLEEEAEAPGSAAGVPPLADGSIAGGTSLADGGSTAGVPPPGLAATSSFPMAVAGVGAWGSESGLP